MKYLWHYHSREGFFCEEVPENLHVISGPFSLPMILTKICRTELRKYGCKVFRSGMIDYSAATVEINYHSGIKNFGLVIETVPRIRIWGGILTAKEFLLESETEFPLGIDLGKFKKIPTDALIHLKNAIEDRGF